MAGRRSFIKQSDIERALRGIKDADLTVYRVVVRHDEVTIETDLRADPYRMPWHAPIEDPDSKEEVLVL